MKITVGHDEKLLERKTLSAQLYQILESKVINWELVPGTRLSEEWVAETFKVSRSPAREALMGLEKSGLAVRVGSRDRMITVPTREMISAKYDLWWIIDAGSTYLSALSATKGDCLELRRYVGLMSRAVASQDSAGYQDACDKWHKKIRAGCVNSFVNRLSGSCDLYLTWLEIPYDSSPDMSEETVGEHLSILEAYESRNVGALSEAIRKHVTRQRDRLLLRFDESRTRMGRDQASKARVGANTQTGSSS